MNEKALRILEFSKVKEEIKRYALTGASKDTIDELTPYENIHEVKEHLQETKEALTLLQKKGTPPFEGLYDVREAVTRAGKGGTLNPGQLLRIGNMVRCARRFIDFIKRKDEEESYNILEDICAGLTPIRKLEDTIFNAIIGEEEISDKASQTLNNIRRSLKEKNSSVRDKVNSILRENSKFLQDNLYTMRGDRYVIPVKAEHKGAVPGLIHDQSSTGATLFIEPMSLVKINNEIKELMLKEKAEIERILQELSGFVYDEIIAVRNNANILNELDFIFAKAKYASAIDGICPAVNDNGIVDLVQAKHPLIDPKRVVSSDIYLGREFTSLVVTGPNTGGKTVTLKTVGLLHIMAMSGVLIPARENSTVSFFREIYADIGDEQSIEQSLSTFSSHMTNIVSIMEEADNESLVLFDELGAGTDPTEGAALAVAILETLRHRNCKIVATTHYSELKGYALRTIGVENASVEFDVETLRPTYKLLIGIPGKSNAFEISRRLGLSDDVIEKSKELISSESLQFEDLIQSLQEKSMKAERDAREAEMLKLDARKLREKYEVKLENLEKTRENAFGEARREAKQILREAKEEADQILKNMRELERLGFDSDARRKLEEQRSKLRDKLNKTESVIDKAEKDNGETIEVVKPGMEAFLPSLNQKVIILTMPDSKGDVQVEAGIMKVNVKLKDLRKSKETKEVKKKVKREVNLNTKSVSSSVDLRGLDAEEACYNADKYLDEAYMAGLGEVSLIHGKGTGILRKSINDMLKSHPHVKSYRLGEYGEGGTGVTVVQLK
ncbi:endonuclease MutS2 [Clostridium fungisolvens]|uniref:Endonuclease MutS2 n=1 Tax=Clostridium fungisolvens TaxID=1604897 RepID=A0A6V8SJL8_9CLOT|nr:endonuclease MutS2 [Clostridium fungisolvens]GFP76762.1 Endonuclease MutS2 [Clostridium fungisolvens]